MATVLWTFVHPDDETLAAGTAMAEHVAAGHDNHLLVLTRGETSAALGHLNGDTAATSWGPLHVPADEGYAPLSVAEFGAQRIAETAVAVRCLAAGLGTVTLHEAQLADGFTQQQAYDAMLAVCDIIAPDGGVVWLKSHSHIVDNHPDHITAGLAARQLYFSDTTRFPSLRQYILPPYWTDSRLAQVSEAWDTPNNADIANRARNACRAHMSWHPPHSFAIGGIHSTPSYFTQLLANIKSMYHLP